MENKKPLLLKNNKVQYNNISVIDSGKLIDKVTFLPYEQESVRNFIKSMIIALEARDTYTKNHSARVSLFSEEIAKNLNLSPETVEVVRIAGLLHDIGKIGVSDKILLKEGRLNENELKAIEGHPSISEDICRPINLYVGTMNGWMGVVILIIKRDKIFMLAHGLFRLQIHSTLSYQTVPIDTVCLSIKFYQSSVQAQEINGIKRLWKPLLIT